MILSISIYNQSFASSQLNGFMDCYITVTILISVISFHTSFIGNVIFKLVRNNLFAH